MVDALERVTNLLALLLETRRPLTLDEIAAELPAYPASLTARRGAFERDKAMLRDLGIPIGSEVLAGSQAGATGYWIDRDRYELRGLELSTDERQALQVAVAAVRSGDARFGLLKLGGAVAGEAAVVTNVPTLDALPTLREAAAARANVRFDYRGTPREVDPYALLLREGFWYVIGFDAGHAEVRTFRVDRIEGDVKVGAAGSFAATRRLRRAGRLPERPEGARRGVGAGDGARRRTSGPVRRGRGRRRRRRRAPAGWRSRARRRLRQPRRVPVVAVRSRGARRGARPGGRARQRRRLARTDDPVSERAARRGPRSVTDRLRRLLVMLPWLMERGHASVEEMSARFEVDAGELIRDLELAAMCGLPPFVDEMIDVFIDDGVVHAGVPRVFTKPLRLTAPEGFALLIAGRAAMQLPGADPGGPLARALAKLAAVLGDDGVVVDAPQPAATADVIAAATDEREDPGALLVGGE